MSMIGKGTFGKVSGVFQRDNWILWIGILDLEYAYTKVLCYEEHKERCGS